MTRRCFISGIAGILAAGRAPAMLIGARDGAAPMSMAGEMNALWLDGTPVSWTHFDAAPKVANQDPSAIVYPSCTISLWARLESKSASGNMRSHVMFSILHTEYGPILDYRDGGFYAGLQEVTWSPKKTMNPFGAWHHFCMVLSGHNISSYVDGISCGSKSTRNYAYSGDGTMSLGGQLYRGTLYDVPRGGLANVEYFDRALSAGDVAALAAGISVVRDDADHLYLFRTGAEDTGRSGGWDAEMGPTARIAPVA